MIATIKYYEWAKVDGKVKKAVNSVDVEEAIELLNEQVKILKAHIFVKTIQNTNYNQLNENLKTNEFIIMSTTAKITKIKNKTKSKVLILIFMACCYTPVIDGTLLNENFTVTSEATNHSQIAAFRCINLVIDSLQKKFPSQLNSCPMFYIWSDGCVSQFGSSFVFALITHFNPDTIQWYYNDRHHGKGPMDRVGETVKNMVFQHAKKKKKL